MDYRELLKKYIQHVYLSEGSTFIGDHITPEYYDSEIDDGIDMSDKVRFSEEEAAELFRLDFLEVSGNLG